MPGRKTLIRGSDTEEWAVISLKPLLPLAYSVIIKIQQLLCQENIFLRQSNMQKDIFIVIVLG